MNKIPDELVPARFSPLVRSLYPELRALLARELAAGNTIVAAHRDLPQAGGIFVGLEAPFRALPVDLPAAVRRGRSVAGGHEEIVAGPPLHVLAAPSPQPPA